MSHHNTIWRLNNPDRWLLNSCRSSAKKKGLEFSIKASDIKIPSHCPYLGIPIEVTVGEGNRPNGPSVDRLDNNKGYTPDNIQVISSLANRMKNSASIDQLMIFAENVIRLHSSCE